MHASSALKTEVAGRSSLLYRRQEHMGRKKTQQKPEPGKLAHLSVAVTWKRLNEIDAEAKRLSGERGSTVRRSDVVKEAIHLLLKKSRSKK